VIAAASAAMLTAVPPAAAAPHGAAAERALRAAPGTSAAQVAAAAPVVRARLASQGEARASVQADGLTLRITGADDPSSLEAVARHDPSALWTVTSTALGPCARGLGAPSSPPGRRCYQLGEQVSATDWFVTAAAQRERGLGWTVRLGVDPGRFQEFRGTVLAHAGETLALLADGAVVATFGVSSATGLQAELSSPMSEWEARRTAAALLVTDTLPARFLAPRPPAQTGPAVNGDFWQAALGAHVCGVWLPNAPSSAPDSGLHSHGDGLVYVHPFAPSEAGRNATLGLFLGRGRWAASAKRLQLWDGATHTNGGRCADGRVAKVRWWVDGRPQPGDPAALRLRNGQVIVLGFDADPESPGPPPQLAALPIPQLEARRSSG
jgi:hypothetical protein